MKWSRSSGSGQRCGYRLVIVALILGCAIVVAPVLAHPPSAVTLSYDQPAKLLSVTISHKVPVNPAGHYVRDVKLTVNGKPAGEFPYTSQPSESFTYTYPLEANAGDSIGATALCSISGMTTGSTTVGGTGNNGGPGSASATAPRAAAGIVPVLFSLLALFLWKRE